jgi:hypothetical protein
MRARKGVGRAEEKKNLKWSVARISPLSNVSVFLKEYVLDT